MLLGQGELEARLVDPQLTLVLLLGQWVLLMVVVLP
jgi:hypothetical protein